MISMKATILGTKYSIIEGSESEFPGLADCDGYTDFTLHKCVIDDMKCLDGNPDALGDLEAHKRRVMRHEIVHAFLEESGLASNSEWARNEEMIDWFAIQSPKIFKVFTELGLL